MKNILLACYLITATGYVTYAQNVTPDNHRPTASKSDFTAKVDQLNTLILASKTDQAKAKFEEINNIAVSEFSVIKFKLRSDIAANDETDKARCLKLNASQKALYIDITALKNDMVANRATLMEKLTQFATDML